MTSVGELLRRRAEEHPDRTFLRCGDDRLTYAQADERSDRVAAGLRRLGLAPGDPVALVVPNRIEMLELFFGCAKAGAVQVPLNVFLKGEFLRYQLEDSGAGTVVVDEAGERAVREVFPGARLACLDPGDGIPYEELGEGAGPPPELELGPSDLMALVYTSGTTGMPKGCMLSHGYHVRSAATSRDMLGYRPGDVLYTALPLFHGWARGMVMGALTNGLEAVFDSVFSASGVTARLADVGATVFTGVGAMGAAMLASPPSPDDRAHNLRCAFIIPFSPDQEEAFHERFGVPVLTQMYGQTECGAVTYARLEGPRRPGTVGCPSPAFEVRLVDSDDRPVPPGEVGEIVVRPREPDTIYSGYWRKPEETLAAWRNLWHHTGDLGRADAEGDITFVDRRSDALRRRGENVSSLELERAIRAHPKVAEVAVHAVPAPLTEDDIKACLVLVPGASVVPDELFTFFRDTLPYFAMPRYVEILDKLPTTATHRVQKHLLRERGVTDATWDLETLGLVVAPAERR